MDKGFLERVSELARQKALTDQRLAELTVGFSPEQKKFAEALRHFTSTSGILRLGEIVHHPKRVAEYGEQVLQLESALKKRPDLRGVRFWLAFHDISDEWQIGFTKSEFQADGALRNRTLHTEIGENLPTTLERALAALPNVHV